MLGERCRRVLVKMVRALEKAPHVSLPRAKDGVRYMQNMPKKILVVDDDVSIADLLMQALSEEGYEVYKTVQSLRFYDAVREHQPQLILLDLMMPYLEGEDELQLMKLSPDTSNIPVIVVTAKPVADVRQEADSLRQLGVRHIITKPFDLNHLVHLVKETIG